jgi:ubiquitin-protein ligase E3 D
MEFVQAHATYRFVVLDEEDELPRILVCTFSCSFVFTCVQLTLLQIWLFKPSLRLAYAFSTPYALPKSGSIHAAKVLYKIMTPSEQAADLNT